MTGNPAVDLLLEAGPRVFDPDVPADVKHAIAKDSSLHWYRDALKLLAQEQQVQMLEAIRQVGRENREIEYKATNGLGLPYCRIPLMVMDHFRALYGAECWENEPFMEDFLKHHPECRIKVTRGTRGQEYSAAGRKRSTLNAQRSTREMQKGRAA